MPNERSIADLIAELRGVPAPNAARPPFDADFGSFSERTRVWVPDEVKRWFTCANGIFGLSIPWFRMRLKDEPCDIEALYLLHPEWERAGWIPIAGDGCGSYYVVATRHEYGDGYPVLFVEHEGGYDIPDYIVASSVQRFAQFILGRECGEDWWPFDKETMLREDPEITKFDGLALPWQADA